MLQIKTLPLGAYQTNCYLVWEEASPTCVVIDPGFQPETILHTAKILGKEIEAILLTHGHFDHVGGVREIAAATHCRVYLHEADTALPNQWTAGPLFHTHFYNEGDQAEFAGVTFRVLHTPGHTPGSVCLSAEEHLFSGDTLFANACGRTDLPGGNWSVIQKSLNRLTKLDKNYSVHPGHGESTTLDKEKMYNPYMR